jgi:predicted anti-sigma-YlaC factor YlaD
MSCDAFQQDLKAYLDGELSEAREAEVERHVQECASCADELEALSDLSWRVAQLAEPEPPPELAARILARVKRRRRRRWVLRLVPVFSGVAALAALALVCFHPWTPEQGPLAPDPGPIGGSYVEEPGTGSAAAAAEQLRRDVSAAYPHSIIVREAVVEFAAADPLDLLDKLTTLAERIGGSVVTSGAEFRLETALEEHQRALRKVRRLGEVAKEEDLTRDVRPLLIDNDVRIRNLGVDVRERRSQLQQAKTIQEIVDIDQNIGRLQEQTQRLRDQKEELIRQSGVGTIIVRPAAAESGTQNNAND